MIVLDLLDDPAGPRRLERALPLEIGGGADVDPGGGPARCRLSLDGGGVVAEPVRGAGLQVSLDGRWHPLVDATLVPLGECVAVGDRRVQIVDVRPVQPASTHGADQMSRTDRALRAVLAASPLLTVDVAGETLAAGGETLGAAPDWSLLDPPDDARAMSEDGVWTSALAPVTSARQTHADPAPLAPGVPANTHFEAHPSGAAATRWDGPEPVFALPDGIVRRPRLSIGHSPSADLRLDDPDLGGQAAEIAFDGRGFVLHDRGSAGLFVGDERITELRLEGGEQVRLGAFVLAFVVEGSACDVSVGRLPVAPVAEAGPAASMAFASPFATVLRRPVDPDAGPAVHRPVRARFAPRWTAPADVRHPLGRGAVAVTLVALIGWSLGAASSDDAVAGRTLGAAHSSPRFASEALERDLQGCGACHSVGVSNARCESCHTDQGSALADAGDRLRRHPEQGCVDCHGEHLAESPPALVAQARCDGCHPADGPAPRHRILTAQRAPRPTPSTATPLAGLSGEALHQVHRGVDGACFACHAADEAPAAVDRSRCLDCHGGEAQLEQPCTTCHFEHRPPTASAPTPPVADRGEPRPSAGGWLAWIPALVVFVPLIGLVRRKPAAERPLVEDDGPADGEWTRKKQIHIEPDLCVACAACVTTCPFAVLQLDGATWTSKVVGVDVTRQIAVVKDFDRCQQEASCEVECPTGALRRAFGEVQLVDAPDIDRHFETALPGVYLAGAVSGVELVKNALNIGHRCVEHAVAGGLAPGGPTTVDGLPAFDIAIIGAGPAGLAAAADARHHGLRHLVVEQGPGIAGMLTDNFPPDKPVQLNPVEVKHLSRVWLPDAAQITWRELRARWAADFSARGPLRETRFETAMSGLERHPQGYLVHMGESRALARRVIIAIGVKSNHNKLGRSVYLPGEQSAKVKRAMIDPTQHVGQRCAVIGCGNAGVECALALAASGIEVTLINHRPTFQVGGRGGMTPENHGRLMTALAASGGRFKAWHATTTTAIEPDAVHVKHGPEATEQTGPETTRPLGVAESRLPNDTVFAMIGARPPLKWLEGLGITLTQRPADWFPERTDDVT